MVRRSGAARVVDDGGSTLPDVPRTCPTCGRGFPADYFVCPRDGAPLGIPTHERDPLVGCVLGGSYRIERAIARGGMGRLYEAAHTRLPRKVAVKVLHEPHAQRKEAVRRFEREASALSRLDHPNVLGVLDFVRTPDGRGAIVTPLLEGETLEQRLARERVLAEREAIDIAIAMCRGLGAAHAAGIVHRDLKPSNVFLSRASEGNGPTVRLLDFGIAKLEGDDMTRTGVVLGTPAYMAPEQARGSARVDARVDVYAVGAVLYRMLVGAMPYDAEDAATALAQLVARAPRSMRARGPVREDLERIVEHAMAREPGERIATAAELAARLEDVRAAPAMSDSAPEARSGALPRERALGIAAGAAATFLGAAMLTALVNQTSRALLLESERALALAFAIVIVGGVAVTGGLGLELGAAIRARFESATALRMLRARIGQASAAGLATIGAIELAVAASGAREPWAHVAAVLAGSAVTAAAWRRGSP